MERKKLLTYSWLADSVGGIVIRVVTLEVEEEEEEEKEDMNCSC